MKKKQLFAVLLAGSMTVGMAPAAAFAAADTGAVTEADVRSLAALRIRYSTRIINYMRKTVTC